MPAGRGYGWLRGWALSGVIERQLVVDIAAPELGPDVAADFSDRGENRDPGQQQKILDEGDAIR